jgi:hypothetical protein
MTILAHLDGHCMSDNLPAHLRKLGSLSYKVKHPVKWKKSSTQERYTLLLSSNETNFSLFGENTSCSIG